MTTDRETAKKKFSSGSRMLRALQIAGAEPPTPKPLMRQVAFRRPIDLSLGASATLPSGAA
jgi:hypothetical protein